MWRWLIAALALPLFYVGFNAYQWVATVLEVNDVSPALHEGEKAILIGDESYHLDDQARLFLTCVDGQPSRLVASWHMPEWNRRSDGYSRGRVSVSGGHPQLGAFSTDGFDVNSGNFRQLLTIGPLAADQVDAVSAQLFGSPAGDFNAAERRFPFRTTDSARRGLRSACAGATN